MRQLGIVIGFAPWIVFTVISGPSTWKWAAATALVVTVVLVVPDWVRTRETNVLDVVSVLFFGGMTLVALGFDRQQVMWVEDRAQLLSSGVLCLVAVGTLAARRPFTEFYARRQTPPEYWGGALFRRINNVLTGVWAVAFLAQALCDVAAARYPDGSDLFNWVLPTLISVAALKFSMSYPDRASARADGPPGEPDRARTGADRVGPGRAAP